MSKAPFKLPNVFVGCPYGGKFKFAAFKATLDRLPFQFFYADTRLQTKHLLQILTKYIATADFCFFDVSAWNPNVSLELGLAEGMDADYYILVNKKLSSGVPSDIQGIQRIEYSNFKDFDAQKGLLPQIVRYLVSSQTHPRNIWDALESSGNREKRYYFALRVLAHFKTHKRLGSEHLSVISRGTYLRREEKEDVLETMSRLGLISSVGSKLGPRLAKNLYREPITA